MPESSQADSNVSIYPERRKKRPLSRNQTSQTETSQYFEPSTTIEKTDDDEMHKLNTPKQRQARLAFTGGQLIMKAPLRNPDSDEARRKRLSEVAAETSSLLPGLLATRPDAPPEGYLCEGKWVEKLDPSRCPSFPPTKIRVINADSIDAALDLRPSSKPPCILNMANAYFAGGGWLHGALAQEECLCYRTSLSFTLKHRFYPIPDKACIYSPTVLIIRESMKDNNKLLDFRDPRKLNVVSIVSVAAVCRPVVTSSSNGTSTYVNLQDERLMKDKIRITLRTAIRNKHRQIVLGALGCGAFGNPREEVAGMFATILEEREFSGGWWEDVVFAVLDDGRGNYQTFQQKLDGMSV